MSISTTGFSWGDTLPDHVYNAVGSFSLPVGVQWDRANDPRMAQDLQFTLGGKVHNRSVVASEGQEIKLVVAFDYCWFNTTRYDAIRSLEAVPGAVYAFKWRDYLDNGNTLDTEYSVIFDHSSGQAVDMGRFTGQSVRVPVDVNLFVGTIHLLRVN